MTTNTARTEATIALTHNAAQLADLNQCVVAKVGGRDVTREELLEAFNKVCDGDDWKAPILAVIKVQDFEMAAAAVMFFTATELEVLKTLPGKCVVEAVGYRAGSAA